MAAKAKAAKDTSAKAKTHAPAGGKPDPRTQAGSNATTEDEAEPAESPTTSPRRDDKPAP